MRVELEIEGLAKGGDAVARHQGRIVFVDRGAPGDRVLVDLMERSGQRELFGHLVEVIAAGPDRVEPSCAVAERCGGCRWMQVAPRAQAAAKERIFYEALARIGHTPRESIEAQPIAQAEKTLGYRRRARLHIRRERLGYLREKTHELVEVSGCPVLEPVLEAAVRALPEALRRFELLSRVKEIDLACEGAAWSLALHVDKLSGAVRDRASQLVRALNARGAVLLAPGAAPALIGKPALGTLRPDVFAQVNAGSNGVLVQAALTQLAPEKGTRVLELFAGSGNFTLPLAAAGAEVVAIESAGPALSLLRAAANARQLARQIHIVEGDALDRARALGVEGKRFDSVLLDPPRAGCSGLGPVLHAVDARKVVYVSCDPATLARDLAELREAGFTPRWARPFDLFPQTPHVEGMVRLERG